MPHRPPTLAAVLCALALLAGGAALAKLPPLSDEAKAKADEARAKAAWSDKVAAFKTCQAMDKAVVNAETQAKKAGKELKPAANAPACADPGPFVYTPPAAAPAASAPASAAKS